MSYFKPMSGVELGATDNRGKKAPVDQRRVAQLRRAQLEARAQQTRDRRTVIKGTVESRSHKTGARPPAPRKPAPRMLVQTRAVGSGAQSFALPPRRPPIPGTSSHPTSAPPPSEFYADAAESSFEAWGGANSDDVFDDLDADDGVQELDEAVDDLSPADASDTAETIIVKPPLSVPAKVGLLAAAGAVAYFYFL